MCQASKMFINQLQSQYSRKYQYKVNTASQKKVVLIPNAVSPRNHKDQSGTKKTNKNTLLLALVFLDYVSSKIKKKLENYNW